MDLFSKNASDLTIVPKEYEKIQEFKDAFEIVTQTTWNTKELEVYEYIALKEFDDINALKTAEKKGLKKGKQEGEKNKQLEIAKSLLDVLDIKTIALKTGLSLEEVKNISK